MSGFFITLEGGEGAGKSSIIKAIKNHLEEQLRNSNREILYTREPGSSSIGNKIRNIILEVNNDNIKLDSKAEALLFAAERAQHMAEKISPVLDNNGIVICDRFIDSSYAYQAKARGLGDFIQSLSLWTTGGRVPDLTIIIDIEPEVGLQRKNDQKELNKMEQESLSFHRNVREAFLKLATSDDGRFFLINGLLPLEEVVNLVLAKIKIEMSARGF
jgi:dTMP kinase